MKISVAMCTYNGETYILEQLKSIINQTKQVDEIIICDDCSSDQTTTLVENALNNTSINYKLIKNEKNMGFKKNFYKVLNNFIKLVIIGIWIIKRNYKKLWTPVVFRSSRLLMI